MSMLTSFDLGALEEMDPSLSKTRQNYSPIFRVSNSRWRIQSDIRQRGAHRAPVGRRREGQQRGWHS